MSWHDTYSPYAKYAGQSVGRILHFIYHYCGLHLAERVTVGAVRSDGAMVLMYGDSTPIATYTWESDVPVFDFYPRGWEGRGYVPYDRRTRDDWMEAQESLRSTVAYPLEYRRSLADKLAKFKKDMEHLSALNELMASSLTNPSAPLVECWAAVTNALPIEQLNRYIQCAKLYEAIKAEKDPG